jgi:hypothetical protein
MANLRLLEVAGYAAVAFVGFVVIVISWHVLTGRIDISHMLSDAAGRSSISRFQLLLFTLVVAIHVAIMEIRTNSVPDIPRGLLILLAISSGTYLASKLISERSSRSTSGIRLTAFVPVAVIMAVSAFIGIAVYRREMSTSRAAILILTVSLTVWFLNLFLQAVSLDGPPHFETNWGGLGGGLGGWRASTSLIYLLCCLVSGTLIFAALRIK